MGNPCALSTRSYRHFSCGGLGRAARRIGAQQCTQQLVGKGAIGRAEFDVDWETVVHEVENKMKQFFPYDCSTGRVYPCDEKIGLVSMRNRRTYRAFDVRLRSFAMILEQYRAHNALYTEKPAMYVRDIWTYRSASPRPAPAPTVHVRAEDHRAYDSYAVSDEPSVPR